MSTSKSILIIAFHFPPVGGVKIQRMVKLIKYIGSYGYRPIVLAPWGEVRHSIDEQSLAEVSAYCEIVRAPILDPLKPLFALRSRCRKMFSRGVARQQTTAVAPRSRARRIIDFLLFPDPAILWLPAALLAGWRLIKIRKIDLILSTSPPYSSHVTASLLSRMTRRPFVADLRDLWVDNPFWQQATKLHLKVARCIEKKVLKRAAAIVCATSALTGILTSRYGEVVTDKTSTIFNGYDPADFESPVATGGKKFTIVHGGSILLGSGRDHLPLTQGFVKAMGRSQEFAVKAELVYFGFMDPRNLDNLADSRRNMADPEKIKYLGPISHSEAIEIVRAAGLLIFLGGREIDSRANVLRQETETHSVAAKMLEYLASGRPVLSIAGACPTVDLARDARVGFWCESYDPVKIADHLVELFERFYVKGAALDPDWNLISRYSRKEQAGQFAAIFDTVLTGG